MTDTNIDILIGKINGLIETLDKYVSGLTYQQSPSIDWGIIIPAIAATITIIVTIVSNKKTRESNEKITSQIQNEENKRAKVAIDANLTANARINWIQSVRQATAELIAASYKYIGSKPEEQQKDWEVVQEKKALFVLYFGPDDDDPQEELANDLHDKNTNKGKNDRLVKFVDELFLELRQYHFYHSEIKKHNSKRSKCNACEGRNEENDENLRECKKDEYGTPFTEEECTRNKNRLDTLIECYRGYERAILGNLQELSEIMRIYGKIEWKRAKKCK